MKLQAFLSASIPIEGRKPFDQDIKIKRIRDAVLALVTICKDRDMELTFGGHPAISPLVHHAAESLGVLENICIYQSEFYRDHLPVAATRFPRLVWTPPGTDEDSSQRIMREEMLDPKHWRYEYAFFIGGMEGILKEAVRFYEGFSGAAMIPLRETGGATRRLEWSQHPDGVHTFPLRFLDPAQEKEATSTLRYRRLLNDCIRTPPPASGP
jgi:SLOG cluster3 family